MIDELSFVNSAGEYAFDCVDRNDMLLRQATSNTIKLVKTEYDSVVVTPDTQILKYNNGWVRADTLRKGDVLKHDLMKKAVVTEIKTYHFDQYRMIKIVDCEQGYLVVNGLFIARDML